jgi:hypothetical protein
VILRKLWNLSLSPIRGVSSQPSGGVPQEPSSSFGAGSDLFEDWAEANDMATSVYVALTVELSSSCAPMATTPRSERKSHAGSFLTQGPHFEMAASWMSHHQKSKNVQAPCKKSKMTKKTAVEDNAAVPLLRGSPLLAANFYESEWEIMYPHFVERSC